MGDSSYSDDLYKARSDDRVARGVPTFDHHDKVVTGKTAVAAHANLDPKGITRESRDSTSHPESLAIAMLFDVTGSMSSVPKRLQEKLPQLMGLLLRKGYVAHPAILFGAIGDSHTDTVPLQIGQFESGLEMDDDITRIYLEGNGGGTYQEGYELALYFMARHTVTDCWEKRKQKGYLFLTGDEMPYELVSKEIVKHRIGDTLQTDIKVEDIVSEVKERWNVFFVIPQHTQHGEDPALKKRWVDLLGPQNVIMLPEEDSICEAIAAAIGLVEGSADMATIKSHLRDSGASDAIVRSVEAGLDPLSKNTALAAVGSGALPETTDGGGTERL
jgi:hypothetical protein